MYDTVDMVVENTLVIVLDMVEHGFRTAYRACDVNAAGVGTDNNILP